jgi:hypothetical protein
VYLLMGRDASFQQRIKTNLILKMEEPVSSDLAHSVAIFVGRARELADLRWPKRRDERAGTSVATRGRAGHGQVEIS